MALKKRQSEQQSSLWVAIADLPRSLGHPFYQAVNRVLSTTGFDQHVEGLCASYYKVGGRPSIPLGVYFRMLFIGYFEGIGSERGIAWRCNDSLSLRQFLGLTLEESTPHHSSLTRIRQRLPLEVQQDIFQFVLKILGQEKLLSGKTLGLDATTLEANAAMRSIQRKDTGESYTEFLTELAKSSGIQNPTLEDLAKLDRKRKKKASNTEWESPADPDAGITKMKDGSTHLAHKVEHAVDLEGAGAIVAVDLSPGHTGDTTSMNETLNAADANLAAVHAEIPEVPARVQEVVMDKGYHSNESLVQLAEDGTRSYVSEPERGPRQWKGAQAAQAAVYGNRRRIRGARGKRLLKSRAEKVERSFAHCYETGGMRRCTLRGTENIMKRLLIHVAGFNLGILMRKLLGKGTPRGLSGSRSGLFGVTLGIRIVWQQSILSFFGTLGPNVERWEELRRAA
jgi:transposase